VTCPNDKRHGCTCTACAGEQTRRELAQLGKRPSAMRLAGAIKVPPGATAEACAWCAGRPPCARCGTEDPAPEPAIPAWVSRHPEVLAHFLTITRLETP
jgi:hypothetical protein